MISHGCEGKQMTVKIKRSKGLEIESEARYFNQTFLNVQKIGFTLMVLFIVAALFGFFGSGWISETQKTHGNLTIQYQKFIRQQSVTILKININQCEKESVVSINKNFFENISIKSISPSPFKETTDNDNIQFSFLCNNSLNGIQVILVIEPEKFGFLQGIIAVGNSKIELTQFAYP